MTDQEVVRLGIEVRRGDVSRVTDALVRLGLPQFGILYPYERAQERQFNPARVTVLDDPPGLTLITAGNLQAFNEEAEGMERGLARRLLGGVGLERNKLQEFGHFVGEEKTQKTIVGIKAKEAEALLAKLQARRPDYKNLGERSILFFGLYCKDLYLPDS